MLQSIYIWIKQNPGTIFKWALFFCLIYFPIFTDLDVLPLRIWDESRLAESAYEMNKYGNYLVTHIQGNPEMWSTKPPLMIWLQVFCIKILGAGVLAIRLPSAIAAFMTCLLIMRFTIRHFKSFSWGFAACMVLITSHGYINMHAARSGDYDAPLTLFITFYCLAFYTYTVTKNIKYITMTFIGIILAALTKGVGGLLFLPALGIFALIKGCIPAILHKKVFYINLCVFLIIVPGYYLLREHYNPGYLKAVYENELGGRYFSTLEYHEAGFWYYYQNLIDFQFKYWYLLLPVGMVIGLANKNILIRNFTLFCTLLLVTFFLIISNGKTKLQWYDVPMYPFMALIIGGLFPLVLSLFQKIENSISLKLFALQCLVTALIFFQPYRTILNETYKPDESAWDVQFYGIENYLQDAIKGSRNLSNYHLCYSGYFIQDLFYTNILTDKGEKIDITDQVNFKNGDKILVCQPEMEDSLVKKYSCSLMEQVKNVKAYRIDSIK